MAASAVPPTQGQGAPTPAFRWSPKPWKPCSTPTTPATRSRRPSTWCCRSFEAVLPSRPHGFGAAFTTVKKRPRQNDGLENRYFFWHLLLTGACANSRRKRCSDTAALDSQKASCRRRRSSASRVDTRQRSWRAASAALRRQCARRSPRSTRLFLCARIRFRGAMRSCLPVCLAHGQARGVFAAGSRPDSRPSVMRLRARYSPPPRLGCASQRGRRGAGGRDPTAHTPTRRARGTGEMRARTDGGQGTSSHRCRGVCEACVSPWCGFTQNIAWSSPEHGRYAIELVSKPV